jgi:transcriptional regulator with XRE-family HTH domain
MLLSVAVSSHEKSGALTCAFLFGLATVTGLRNMSDNRHHSKLLSASAALDEHGTKQPRPVDQLVGARVRVRREAKGLSQTELGRALGISYQQVQKYELGRNRIGSSRLAAIAAFLEVPVSYFFEELPSDASEADSGDEVIRALRMRGSVELLRAYADIRDPAMRANILQFVETAARACAGYRSLDHTADAPKDQPRARKRRSKRPTASESND